MYVCFHMHCVTEDRESMQGLVEMGQKQPSLPRHLIVQLSILHNEQLQSF